MNPTLARIAWAAYEADNARANAEYWETLAALEATAWCRSGRHEFTEENTRWSANGKRHCRACERETSKRKWGRKRAHAASNRRSRVA